VIGREGQADPRADMPRDDAATVMIVHGAWADATSWREVIALLQANALSVVAMHNPLSALADDVDAVTRAINLRPGPVVLVGHGYGGTVITQAGNHPSVGALARSTRHLKRAEHPAIEADHEKAETTMRPLATRQARDARGSITDDSCWRIKADFEEMPDLTVTTEQAARFWAVDEHVARAALQRLEERGILRQTRLGFRRSS